MVDPFAAGDLCAKDQRSSHFGACRICFQLAGRRGVTVLKPLVFGNHLRAKQEDDAGDFEAHSPTIVVASEP